MNSAILGAIFALIGVLVGAGLTFAGQLVSSSRARDAKMVEIAVGILRTEPTEGIVGGARGWAIRVIETYSIALTDEEKESLTKHALPYRPSLDFSDPRNSQYAPLL